MAARRIELSRVYTWAFLALNALIATLLLLRLFWGSGPHAPRQNVDLTDFGPLLLVWFALSYLTYRRVGFERWCAAKRRLSVWNWYHALAKTVVDNYRPMVRLLESSDEVSLAARSLITDPDNVPIFLNGKVVFLGAAANQSDRSKRESSVRSEDSERSPVQIYQGAVEEAMSKLSPIYRIVSLLTPEEFSKRSLDKRRQYISWMGNQISQLKRNPNYVLLDNKRAPKWGTAGAAILSSSGYLQFTRAGGNALFVRDRWLSRHMMSAIMVDLTETKVDNKQAYTQMDSDEIALYSSDNEFGRSLSADDLSKLVEKLGERSSAEKRSAQPRRTRISETGASSDHRQRKSRPLE
jgi:hypothetical protein